MPTFPKSHGPLFPVARLGSARLYSEIPALTCIDTETPQDSDEPCWGLPAGAEPSPTLLMCLPPPPGLSALPCWLHSPLMWDLWFFKQFGALVLLQHRVSLALIPKSCPWHTDNYKTRGVLFHTDKLAVDREMRWLPGRALQTQNGIITGGHKHHPVPFLCLPNGASDDGIVEDNGHRSEHRGAHSENSSATVVFARGPHHGKCAPGIRIEWCQDPWCPSRKQRKEPFSRAPALRLCQQEGPLTVRGPLSPSLGELEVHPGHHAIRCFLHAEATNYTDVRLFPVNS